MRIHFKFMSSTLMKVEKPYERKEAKSMFHHWTLLILWLIDTSIQMYLETDLPLETYHKSQTKQALSWAAFPKEPNQTLTSIAKLRSLLIKILKKLNLPISYLPMTMSSKHLWSNHPKLLQTNLTKWTSQLLLHVINLSHKLLTTPPTKQASLESLIMKKNNHKSN